MDGSRNVAKCSPNGPTMVPQTDQQSITSLFRNTPKMISILQKSFYITEQSDAWACIEISGSQIYNCLERICILDLCHSSFEINSATRTLMEHLNVFVIKVTEENFLLLLLFYYQIKFD